MTSFVESIGTIDHPSERTLLRPWTDTSSAIIESETKSNWLQIAEMNWTALTAQWMFRCAERDFGYLCSVSVPGLANQSRDDDSFPGITASRLSTDFWGKLIKFMCWEPNWDGLGAQRITMSTAMRAVRVAELAIDATPEPFVAPAGDGSLMLEWELPAGVVVGLFVSSEEGDDAWEPASISRGTEVIEHDIRSAADLVDLLRQAADPTHD